MCVYSVYFFQSSTVLQDSISMHQYSSSRYNGPQSDRVATLKDAFNVSTFCNFYTHTHTYIYIFPEHITY